MRVGNWGTRIGYWGTPKGLMWNLVRISCMSMYFEISLLLFGVLSSSVYGYEVIVGAYGSAGLITCKIIPRKTAIIIT